MEMKNKEIEMLNGTPVTEKQKVLQTIWAEILDIPNVGINDDFFMLGGTSKDLVRMINKLSTIFEVSIQDVFSKSTIAQIAPLIEYRKDGLKDDVDKIYNLTEKLRKYQPSTGNLKYMEDYEAYNERLAYTTRTEYEHVFITGGNGFLACHLIERLLKHRKSKLTVLVREKNNERAFGKLQRAFDWYFPNEELVQNYRERLWVIAGDVEKELMGIPEEKYLALTDKIDCIFHTAGILRHYGHWSDFYNANVNGTKNIIEFAKKGKKKSINFISTMGTGYNEERAKTVLPFTELEVQKDSYAENYYLKSKMLAEKELEMARENEQLDVKIYRPGYLVQNYETGIFQINANDNAYFEFFKAITQIGLSPSMKTNIFDFSFIDQAAEAIDILSTVQEEGHIYHLFNPKRLSMEKIGQLMIQNGVNMELVSVEEFCDFLKSNIEKFEDLISNLTMVSYVNEKGIEQLIDLCLFCDRTVKILKEFGFEWKDLDEKHMADILKVIAD